MKVLDEKGRLFGKVNLIDLIVVLLVIAVVAAVGWKLAGDEVAQAVSSIAPNPTIRYEVVCTAVRKESCDYALEEIGAQLMSNGDMVNGHIVDCAVEPYHEVFLNNEGEPVYAESPDASNLRFTIEAKLEDRIVNAVGSQEVRVGRTHIVKTLALELTGIVTSLEEVTGNG